MTREGGRTREGHHDERVGEKAQMTEKAMTETGDRRRLRMTTTMNDEDNDVNERWRFNNQLE